MTLHVDIIAVDQALYSGEAVSVTVPGEEGILGVYPGHVPLFTRLQLGPVRVQVTPADSVDIAIAGGVLEVTKRSVLVLADQARRTEESDRAAIEAAYASAQEMLSQRDVRKEDDAALERELAMLKVQLALLRRRR